MSVASHHHGLVDACVSNAFREILQNHSATCASQTADEVVHVARDIESAVKAAILRGYTAWNDAHPDPVRRLPRELVLECFAALDSKGLIAVTQVSRAWRSLALSDSRLWSSLSFPATVKRPTVALNMLATFIHRSDPRPFSLSSMRNDGLMSGGALNIIIQHLHRIETIKSSYLSKDDQLLLCTHPAPILKTFVCRNLWSLWGGDMAPCLENLEVQYFVVLAALRPIRTLRMFTGHLQPHLSPAAFFQIFPCLTTLNLHGVTQETLNNFGWFTPSVTSLSLYARRQAHMPALDYSPVIPTLTGLNLSSLFLGSASSILNVVQLFVDKTHGERRLDIPWRNDVQMESDTDGIRFTINTSSLDFSLSNEPGLLDPLRAFSALSLTLELLVAVRGSLPEVIRALPSLRSLNIVLDWMDGLEYLRNIREPGGGPVDAPQLQCLTFTVLFVGLHAQYHRLAEFASWLGTDLPAALPLIVSYPRPNISSITIQAEDDALLMRCGADNIRRLAAGLFVSQLNILNLQTLKVTELPLQVDAASLLAS